MKKEKTIKTYQRRTKSGKVVTVKQHTAKYDAADKAKEMASKKGAGEELAAKKGMPDHNLPMNEYLAELKKMRENPDETPMEQETKKSSPSAEKKSKSVKSTKSTKNAATTQANGVSASEFKSWYHFNDWDKPKKSWPAEVRAADAAIRKQLGSKKAYDDYCSQIDGSYSKSGHNKAFKSFGGAGTSTSAKSSPEVKSEKISKVSDTPYSAATKKKWNATFLKAAAKAGIDEATVNKMGDTHGNLTDSSMRLFAGHSGAKKAYSDAKKEEKALYASLTDSQKAFYRKYFDYKGAESKPSTTSGAKSKATSTQWYDKPYEGAYNRTSATPQHKAVIDYVDKVSSTNKSTPFRKYVEGLFSKGLDNYESLKPAHWKKMYSLMQAEKGSKSKPNGKSAPFSKSPVDTGSTKGNLKRAVAEGRITQAEADAIMGKKPTKGVTKSKATSSKTKAEKSEFTPPRHSVKYKYKGETYYIKRKNVGGLIYKPTDVLNSKGEKLSKNEADIIKAAQQKSAKRADRRLNRRSEEYYRLHGWGPLKK